MPNDEEKRLEDFNEAWEKCDFSKYKDVEKTLRKSLS